MYSIQLRLIAILGKMGTIRHTVDWKEFYYCNY
jgi:hypothetical protein